MSLRDGAAKMSKSDPSDMSRINLADSPDEVMKKVRKANTDPEPLPSEEGGLAGRAEAQNLVTIYAALSDRSVPEVLQAYGGQGFGAFKQALGELMVDTMTPISERFTASRNVVQGSPPNGINPAGSKWLCSGHGMRPSRTPMTIARRRRCGTP